MLEVYNIAFILKILAISVLANLVLCLPTSKPNTTTSNVSSVFSSTDKASRLSSVKKWQVGRVSRKHYEIVNMLWRKTKIFVDFETTTSVENRYRRNNPRTTNYYSPIKPLTYTTSKPSIYLTSSTPSYIEFYYLDDNDERVKRRDAFTPNFGDSLRRRQLSFDNIFLESPILSFRVNDQVRKEKLHADHLVNDKPAPITSFRNSENVHSTISGERVFTNKRITENSQHRKQPVNEKPSIYGILSSRFKIGFGPMVRPIQKDDLENLSTTTSLYLGIETCPSTTMEPENSEYFRNSSEVQLHTKVTIEITNKTSKTTAYDRIKFFEMYDDHTLKSINKIEKVISHADYSENLVNGNEIVSNEKTYLEDIHGSRDYHDDRKSKNVKKHIDQKNTPGIGANKDIPDKKIKFKTVIFNVNKTVEKLRHTSKKVVKNSSRVASWSEFPFAAVYVYEPSQIHCDAAALSSHWLVAAGYCLSRFNNKDSESDGRSAFVAYCGQRWWQPERVSYVKYSIVHPRFNPKDDTRKYLFNIGLVQVVGSMSSCFGWAPISLMSHNFAAGSDGSVATAVGWGLDRYDVRYSPVVLPKQPLSAYNSFVYSESCPGSTAFSKEKIINEESKMKNTYCLSLPPYFGELNDPVHGSLLLVGGKLIALYLQEERRSWGEQSAQYTGVWRLVPWVHEVAREPDETDGFAIDL